jgi:hypothetical protein
VEPRNLVRLFSETMREVALDTRGSPDDHFHMVPHPTHTANLFSIYGTPRLARVPGTVFLNMSGTPRRDAKPGTQNGRDSEHVYSLEGTGNNLDAAR